MKEDKTITIVGAFLLLGLSIAAFGALVTPVFSIAGYALLAIAGVLLQISIIALGVEYGVRNANRDR